MNNKKYQWILYLIVVVILCTIGIQIYWNYKNYQTNKQQLINDVQISLDNAVNEYYANLAQRSSIGLIREHIPLKIKDARIQFDSLIHQYDSTEKYKSKSVTVMIDTLHNVRIVDDSILGTHGHQRDDNGNNFSKLLFKDYNFSQEDSLTIDNYRTLTSQVIISLSQDTVNLKAIDSLVKIELDRKQISVDYNLKYETTIHFRRIPSDSIDFFDQNMDFRMNSNSLSAIAKSTFLPPNDILKIEFSNATMSILKRILSGILISTLLVLAVISCLFYLLRIIKHQKQLSEVKNDLISNITHEFKTPIATIGVALESIKNFNVIQDKEKTKSYLDMSAQQLKKLNVMVEKLLETATLDSDSLILQKEPTDLIELLNGLAEKHKLGLENKTINFTTSFEKLIANIDVFHFENAVNNIIDNAIKYGGDTIEIKINKENHDIITIEITDNGRSITKANKNRIFEKFFRIPTGNTHDIKGFGIGLYFSKSIIEKHDGQISVDLNNVETTFKISIPK